MRRIRRAGCARLRAPRSTWYLCSAVWSAAGVFPVLHAERFQLEIASDLPATLIRPRTQRLDP